MTAAALTTIGAAGTASLAQEWKPADGPLMTRWAEEVSPDNVLPEYPRPQMVRDDWTNLNGLWNYAVTDSGEDRPKEWTGKILVPFAIESALSGVMERVSPEQTLWYQRTIEAPDMSDGQRVLLHFGAVDWHARIHLNGEQIGEHKGGYDPFSFDITDQLKEGENELVVRVTDPTDTAHQPHGKQFVEPHGIWYTPVTGIWQTVWMETVPEAHIKSLHITPDLDNKRVQIKVNAEGDARITAAVSRHGLEKKFVAEGDTVTIHVPDPALWSPGSPNLYDVTISLTRDGETLDEVESYFAMRKIEVKEDEKGHLRMFLNNEPLFHYGMLDQGWWPDGLYTAPTDEALKYDLEMTKKWGFNTSRKHVKVEPARWYYHCDQMGILVWQDMPSVNDPSPEWIRDVDKTGPEADFPEEAAEQFRTELSEIVKDLYNHPSIVMWVPFNERWGQHNTAGTVKHIRELDPTRLVNSASGGNFLQVGDVLDVHSYPNPAFPRTDDEQTVVCGEFGGLGLPVAGHTWQDEENWGYRSFETQEELTEAYVEKLDMIPSMIAQGLAGAIYTQTTDVEIEVNGLMTYDREVIKIDPATATDAAEQLYKPAGTLEVVVPTAREGDQMWSYTTEKPAEGWQKPEFDDSSWKTGPGGFGTRNTPGSVVNTEWTTEDVWLRREFELKEVPEGLMLMLHHDDAAEIYVNGVLARKMEGYATDYAVFPLGDEGYKALEAGRNVIAIHCHQAGGDQYIDAGLMRVIEAEASPATK